jgi:hypothetical protein
MKFICHSNSREKYQEDQFPIKKFSPQSQTPHLVTLNPTKLEIFFGTDP